jgi:arginine exporter protein ArgO
VLAPFLAGAAAGYAIAMPVGVLSVLVVEMGIGRGFRMAAIAGLGVGSADGLYAALAVVGGSAAAALLEPYDRALKIVAIVALLGIGLRGLALLLVVRRSPSREALKPARPIGTYLRFFVLTLLNPATVIYFAALILALPNLGHGPAERAAFVAGAFLSSLSWQTTLAAIGALAHHRLPPRFQLLISVVGNLVICGFAVVIARGL